MVAVIVPIVVDSMEKGVTSDLWCATGGLVDVVSLEGDQVRGAGEVHVPVMISVAGCGP